MQTRMVICASGEGSNFEAIVQASRSLALAAQISGLIVSRSDAGVLERAARLQVPQKILNPKQFDQREAWDQAFLKQLQEWQADWVVLAGFLSLIGPRVLKAYAGRVVNSHPSLLPKHGGAGMYGERVHQAVISGADLETGITIHLVDAAYDRGRILAQEKVSVLAGDTAVTLGARVKAAERVFYPRILNDLVTGRITTG